MSETETRKHPKKRVWALTRFDLEGIVGAAAAFVAGILLGWLWDPLFWLGFSAAGFILLATRTQGRTPPGLANLVVSPCDGVVHSIVRALPPTELRLSGGERLRLRIASSPVSTNTLHACITGEIDSVILEEPDSSVIVASQPDIAGLAVAHITLAGPDQKVGCTVATGGFGPRLEMTSEPGDPVRLGRVIGKRRLGGWCDVYLAVDAKLHVIEGQSLIGAETVLCHLLHAPAEGDVPEAGPSEYASDPNQTLGDMGEAAASARVSEDVSPENFEVTETGADDPEDAAVKLFKKLTADQADKE